MLQKRFLIDLFPSSRKMILKENPWTDIFLISITRSVSCETSEKLSISFGKKNLDTNFYTPKRVGLHVKIARSASKVYYQLNNPSAAILVLEHIFKSRIGDPARHFFCSVSLSYSARLCSIQSRCFLSSFT